MYYLIKGTLLKRLFEDLEHFLYVIKILTLESKSQK